VKKLVFDVGAEVNHISHAGFTPLHFCALAMKPGKWQEKYAEYLLKAGACPSK